MPTATPYLSARPALRLAGREHPGLAEDLLSLEVTEQTEGLYRLEAVLGNWGSKGGRVDFLYFDRQLLDFGTELEVDFGGRGIFQGRVTALEGQFPAGRPPQLSVLAEDRLQDLRMTRRSRSFEDLSDQEVFGRIASDHGLQTDLDLGGPTHRALAQVNQSDLAFLRERARAIGAEVWVEGRTLKARSRAGRAGSAVELTHGGGLRAFTVLADLAQQCTELVVSGWDVAGKEAIRVEAGESVIRGELDGAQSGAGLLRSAFGARAQVLAHTAPRTSREAQARAEATFRLLARRFVVGQGVAEPDARLRVGATVDLKGLGPLFSGSYYLSQTRFRFDDQHGSRLEFTAERPGLGQP